SEYWSPKIGSSKTSNRKPGRRGGGTAGTVDGCTGATGATGATVRARREQAETTKMAPTRHDQPKNPTGRRPGQRSMTHSTELPHEGNSHDQARAINARTAAHPTVDGHS